MCAFIYLVIYGSHPVCSETGFRGQKGVARGWEAPGWLNSLPLTLDYFWSTRARWSHAASFLGLLAVGGVLVPLWKVCGAGRHCRLWSNEFQAVRSGSQPQTSLQRPASASPHHPRGGRCPRWWWTHVAGRGAGGACAYSRVT